MHLGLTLGLTRFTGFYGQSGFTFTAPSGLFNRDQANLFDQSHLTLSNATGDEEVGEIIFGGLGTATASMAGLGTDTFWLHTIVKEEEPASSYRPRFLSPTNQPGLRNRGLQQVWPLVADSNAQAQFLAGSAWTDGVLQYFQIVPMTAQLAKPWKIIVAMGQSNMAAGATTSLGITAEQDGWTHENLLQWPGSTQAAYGTTQDVIHAAYAPLQMTDTTVIRGLSPALSFARTIAGQSPDHNVVIVCAAIPGTGLLAPDAPWNSQGSNPTAYDFAVARLNACLAAAPVGSEVITCLWAQGEADTSPDMSAYPPAFASMRSDFETATGIGQVPWGIIGPPSDSSNINIQEFLRVQEAMDENSGGPESQPLTYYTARTSGFIEVDGTHVSAAGQRIHGQKAAVEFVSRNYGASGDWIMETGFWNDTGIWDDASNWKDTP